MLVNIIVLIIGFFILIKGADIFIDGASGIANHFKVSKMLIGLTIVAFGTGTPELAIGIKSVISGSGNIVLGNAIGSNIINILLVLGVSSLIHPLVVKNNTVRRELPLVLVITVLFSILIPDHLFSINEVNSITRREGIVLLLFFAIFVYYLITMMRNKIADDSNDAVNISLTKAIIYTLVGLVCIAFGSDFVVDKATIIAKDFGISERIIGLTIISLGTTLPELVTSITATKKREYDIAIGNVVGTIIFNLCIVVGLPVVLFGPIVNVSINIVDLITMLLSTIFLFIFSYNDYKITKLEGFMSLILFSWYYLYVIFA